MHHDLQNWFSATVREALLIFYRNENQDTDPWSLFYKALCWNQRPLLWQERSSNPMPSPKNNQKNMHQTEFDSLENKQQQKTEKIRKWSHILITNFSEIKGDIWAHSPKTYPFWVTHPPQLCQGASRRASPHAADVACARQWPRSGPRSTPALSPPVPGLDGPLCTNRTFIVAAQCSLWSADQIQAAIVPTALSGKPHSGGRKQDIKAHVSEPGVTEQASKLLPFELWCY